MMQKIAIGADHAGYALKEQLKKWLETGGHTTHDFGTYSEESVDYPDFAHPVAEALEVGQRRFLEPDGHLFLQSLGVGISAGL